MEKILTSPKNLVHDDEFEDIFCSDEISQLHQDLFFTDKFSLKLGEDLYSNPTFELQKSHNVVTPEEARLSYEAKRTLGVEVERTNIEKVSNLEEIANNARKKREMNSFSKVIGIDKVILEEKRVLYSVIWTITNSSVNINDDENGNMIIPSSNIAMANITKNTFSKGSYFLELYLTSGRSVGSVIKVPDYHIRLREGTELLKGEQALELIQNAMSKPVIEKNFSSPFSDSIADEIRKLKSLVDDGILTQEEFDHKKRILLKM